MQESHILAQQQVAYPLHDTHDVRPRRLALEQRADAVIKVLPRSLAGHHAAFIVGGKGAKAGIVPKHGGIPSPTRGAGHTAVLALVYISE